MEERVSCFLKEGKTKNTENFLSKNITTLRYIHLKNHNDVGNYTLVLWQFLTITCCLVSEVRWTKRTGCGVLTASDSYVRTVTAVAKVFFSGWNSAPRKKNVRLADMNSVVTIQTASNRGRASSTEERYRSLA